MNGQVDRSTRRKVTIDGNEAAAYIAYHLNEVCAIYPITPSSTMGEWCDAWAAQREKYLWGIVPTVSELQSEGGASGAVHGALQTGSFNNHIYRFTGIIINDPEHV